MNELQVTILNALWQAQGAYDAAWQFGKSQGEKEYALGRLDALKWVLEQVTPVPPNAPPQTDAAG